VKAPTKLESAGGFAVKTPTVARKVLNHQQGLGFAADQATRQPPGLQR